MSSLGVVLDACVLVPAATRDTLLRAAEMGMYRPLWSNDILGELERTLLRLFSGRGDPDAATKVQRLLAELLSQFPEAIVSGYEPLIPLMMNHSKDRHVVAVAVASKAQCIVTENLKDFPDFALAPHQLEAQSADDFLKHLFALDPDTFCTIIEQQGADRNPSRTFDEQLRSMVRQVPGLIAAVSDYVASNPR